MSKFQPPMLKDDVCRTATDKQTHKHTHIQKTYIQSKNRGNLFLRQFFKIFYSSFSNSLKIKRRFPTTSNLSIFVWEYDTSESRYLYWDLLYTFPCMYSQDPGDPAVPHYSNGMENWDCKHLCGIVRNGR